MHFWVVIMYAKAAKRRVVGAFRKLTSATAHAAHSNRFHKTHAILHLGYLSAVAVEAHGAYAICAAMLGGAVVIEALGMWND